VNHLTSVSHIADVFEVSYELKMCNCANMSLRVGTVTNSALCDYLLRAPTTNTLLNLHYIIFTTWLLYFECAVPFHWWSVPFDQLFTRECAVG
jgi:hypothetical protein